MTMTATDRTTAPFSTRPPPPPWMANCVSFRDGYHDRAILFVHPTCVSVGRIDDLHLQECQPKLRILSPFSLFTVSINTVCSFSRSRPTLSLSVKRSLLLSPPAPTATSLTCWDGCISIFSRLQRALRFRRFHD